MARKQKWWFLELPRLGCFDEISGIALFPALLVEWWLGKRQRRNLIPLILIPLATLNYFLYIHFSRGSWRLFITSMQVWQQGQFVLPFQTAYRYFKIFATVTPDSLMYLVAVTEFAAVVFAIVVLIKGFRLVRLSYWVYAVSYLLIPMSGGTFQGEPRYIIHTFPVILIFSQLMAKNRWRYLVMGVLFSLQLILMAFFFQRIFYFINIMIILSPQLGISPTATTGGETYDRELLKQFVKMGQDVRILLPKNKSIPVEIPEKVVDLTLISHFVPPYIFNLFSIPWVIQKVQESTRKCKKVQEGILLRIHSPEYLFPTGYLIKSCFPRFFGSPLSFGSNGLVVDKNESDFIKYG